MNTFFNNAKSSVQSFINNDEGAQVVEYALIIAVVSIGLVLALSSSTTGLTKSFSALVTRLTTCFTAGSTCT